MYVTQRTFSGAGYLHKLASSIAHEHKVKVRMEYGVLTHAEIGTKTIYLNTGDAWKYGDEYVVGNLLHEIGHIHHTPITTFATVRKGRSYPRRAHELHNMLEDERINSVIAKQYAGGAFYLDAFLSEPLGELAERLNQPQIHTGMESEQELRQEMAGEIDPSTPLEHVAAHREAITRRIKEMGYWAIIATAACRRHGRRVPDLTIPKWQSDAKILERMLVAAEEGNAEEVAQIARDAYTLLEEYITEDSGAESTAGMFKALQEGGYGSSDDDTEESDAEELARWSRNDIEAQTHIARLRREIVSKLRDNDHQRFLGSQKRGKIDKRAIHKIVRGAERVHRQRVERKGKSYAASIILDTSGSQWNCGTIDGAMQASALLLRTLRGIGIPTSLTFYGTTAHEMVAHGAIYRSDTIGETISTLEDDTGEVGSGRVYNAGDNETRHAIQQQLPLLRKAGVSGRHKLMIIITDGALMPRDREESKEMLEAEVRRGGFTPLVLYIGRNEYILGEDREHQANFTDIRDLVPAAGQLIKKIVTA